MTSTTPNVDDLIDNAVIEATEQNTVQSEADAAIQNAFGITGQTPVGGGLPAVQPLVHAPAAALSLDDLDAIDSSFVPEFWVQPAPKGAVTIGERSLSEPFILGLVVYSEPRTMRLHYAMKYGTDADPKTIRSYDGVTCNSGEYAGKPWMQAVQMVQQTHPDKAPYPAAALMFHAVQPFKETKLQAAIPEGSLIGHITSKTTFTNSAKTLLSIIKDKLKKGELNDGDEVLVQLSSKDQSYMGRNWEILTMKYLGARGSKATEHLDLTVEI